jgi:arylsulfatase A-like enzyme
VIAALEQAGVADRTLIVFTSDNGSTHEGKGQSHFHAGGTDVQFFNSTAGLRGYKGSVYEGGIRVPMIARLPGRITGGMVNNTPSYFADWLPTLCDAAGLEKPSELDGDSLWPVLTGQQISLDARKPMIWVFTESQGQVAVRLGDFKLVRQRLKTNSPGPWEVYDISKDPGETTDLATEMQALTKQTEELLRREVADNTIFPLEIPGVNVASH